MSFKYVNPGYAELLPTNMYFSYATLEDWTHNSQNGIMTYFVNGSYNYSRTIALAKFSGEVYGKYITYCKDNYGSFEILLGNSYAYLQVSYSNARVYCNSKILDRTIANNDGFHSVYFNYKPASGDNTGLFVLIVDDVSLLSYSHSYSTSDGTIRLACSNSTGVNYCIGNIIFSDEYINPKEEVIILPTSAIETDMTDNGDGTYTADEAGQTLLQTINANDLITQYGKTSKVTSIAVAGVPAYNSTGALSLMGIDKINGSITEHDTIAVGTSDSVGAIDLWNTDITISELNGKQVGWKAAS